MPGESTPVVTVTSPGRTISLIKEKEMWGRRRGAVKDWMHAHHDASVPTVSSYASRSIFLSLGLDCLWHTKCTRCGVQTGEKKNKRNLYVRVNDTKWPLRGDHEMVHFVSTLTSLFFPFYFLGRAHKKKQRLRNLSRPKEIEKEMKSVISSPISFFLMTRTNFWLPLRGAFYAVLVMEKEIV